MGLMNIWCLIYNRKSNRLHLQGSPHSHLSRLKTHEDSSTSSVYWDTSHFLQKPLHLPAGVHESRRGLFTIQQIGCLWPRMCYVAILYRAKLNHSQCDIAIISGAIQWSTAKCTGDFLFHASTWESNLRATSWNLNYSDQNDAETFELPPHSAASKQGLNNVIKQAKIHSIRYQM